MSSSTPRCAVALAAASPTTKPRGSSKATLQDYRHFHAMLCRPATARRCIDSVQRGTVLFLPHSYPKDLESLSDYDCSGGLLNLWTYYGLVLFSLTGLLTLLNLATVHAAQYEHVGLASRSAHVRAQHIGDAAAGASARARVHSAAASRHRLLPTDEAL